uniref:Uncharacterized protein n=1 Tax=Daphnia galeata TaxID=27404 RepID=A0A8J2RSK5_9CRUS|nr:unnamed protein product [Daphnia galeata]
MLLAFLQATGDYFASPSLLNQKTLSITPERVLWLAFQGCGFQSIPSRTGVDFSREAKADHDSFKKYFNLEVGTMPWQNAVVDHHDGFDMCDN